MINILTKVKILDNSGALEGRCIKILKPADTKSGRRKKSAKVGDLILISITKIVKLSKESKEKKATKRIKKGGLYKALIVRTKKESNKERTKGIKENYKNKLDTINNKYSDNGVVLVKLGKKTESEYTPIGTRIKGPLCKSLRNKKDYIKVISVIE